jgi:HlyD family secretion protein
MTATVDIITSKKNNVIGVPISSIVIKTDTSSTKKRFNREAPDPNAEKFECVFVKNGDEAKLRVVTTGIQDDTNIEIESGLSEGDIVITGPYNTVTKTLSSGDKVSVESKESLGEKDE